MQTQGTTHSPSTGLALAYPWPAGYSTVGDRGRERGREGGGEGGGGERRRECVCVYERERE